MRSLALAPVPFGCLLLSLVTVQSFPYFAHTLEKPVAHLRFWEDRILTASQDGAIFVGPASDPSQSKLLARVRDSPAIEALDFNHGLYSSVSNDRQGYSCRLANTFTGTSHELPLGDQRPLLVAVTKVGYRPSCAVVGYDGTYRLFDLEGTVQIHGKVHFTLPVAPHAASLDGHTLAVRQAHNTVHFYDLLTEMYTHKVTLNSETYIRSLVLQDHRLYFTTPWDLLYSVQAFRTGAVKLVSRDAVEAVDKASSGFILVRNKKSVGICSTYASELHWTKAPSAVAFDYDAINRNIAWVSPAGIVHLVGLREQEITRYS